ncbi:MAG: hypothetical protein IJ917_11460 [Firmicutes bacterium]|nr:hypothetical protein [Bacillota bacterium]
MKKTPSIKRLAAVVLLVVMLLNLTACSKDQVIRGTYQSEDKATLLVCDRQLLYIVEDEAIYVSDYMIDGDTLNVGGNVLKYDREDDSKITIGSETYTKTSCPLSVRWRLIKWASENRIKSAKLGIIQWAILDPIFMESTNSYGFYAMVGSWAALIGIVLVILILIIIFYNISQSKKKKSKKR